jgi:hypothetical protein
MDTGFTAQTPRPDPDLIIVREEAYGTEGVDLTAYGIGDGPVQFVQSIYFRFFVDNINGSVDSFIGLVEFPPEITILGIITEGDHLGGSVNDGVATDTDSIFGIAPDPDHYSELHRGLEPSGQAGTSEFVGLDTNSFVFGLNIEEGVDDLRVIIDYGDAFGDELSFDVYAYDIGKLGGAPPTIGFRVGNDEDPVVFGSGDYSEVGSVHEIPLTSTTPVFTGDVIPFDPLANLYILRDTNQDTYVDGYDVSLNLPAPGLVLLNQAMFNNPVGITDGRFGKVYALDRTDGLGIIVVNSGYFALQTIEDLVGLNVDITNLASFPDFDDLFILRDRIGADAFVDRLNLQGYVFTDHITLDQTIVGDPVAITDGGDGLLYVLGDDGDFASIDPFVPTVTDIALLPPEGEYVDLTSGVGVNEIYLLRDTGADTKIDLFDISTGTTTYDFASFAEPDSAGAITDGPGDLLYVIGVGYGGPAAVTVIDPADGSVISIDCFMDFDVSNVSITNIVDIATAVEDDRTPGSSAALRHWSAPNPFNARVTISYEIDQPTHVRVALFDLHGRLIRMLQDTSREAGSHATSWDGRDLNGRMVASGTYLYRVEAGSMVGVGKVVLAK